MNNTITLSESALVLLREYRGDIVTDDSNCEACRELAAAGYLVAGHTFAEGREEFYRMTQASVELATEHGWMQGAYLAIAFKMRLAPSVTGSSVIPVVMYPPVCSSGTKARWDFAVGILGSDPVIGDAQLPPPPPDVGLGHVAPFAENLFVMFCRVGKQGGNPSLGGRVADHAGRVEFSVQREKEVRPFAIGN